MKLVDFLDYIYRNTENNKIKWEENNGKSYTIVCGDRKLVLHGNGFYINDIFKDINDMDNFSRKIYLKLWDNLSNEERIYDYIVKDLKKCLDK